MNASAHELCLPPGGNRVAFGERRIAVSDCCYEEVNLISHAWFASWKAIPLESGYSLSLQEKKKPDHWLLDFSVPFVEIQEYRCR
jgi:hypothetical protein